MRDPERINRILEFIRTIWSRNPDIRLGQLINQALYIEGKGYLDLFFIEDEELLKKLEAKYFKFPE